MRNIARQERLIDLQAQIAAIERRPPQAVPSSVRSAIGEGGGEKAALAAPAGGLLHEVFADARQDGAAALGFALGMARACLGPERRAILLLQLAHEGQELGLPYGSGLATFGLGMENLIFGRLAQPLDLLWAMEEAATCSAVAAVIGELPGLPRALDFTASRRLSLKAAESGVALLLLRHGREREASAARRRWRIEPAASRPPVFDGLAPGMPRWRVALEKGGRSAAFDGQAGLLLEWSENGFAWTEPEISATAIVPRPSRTPAPGFAPAAVGHRLSRAG